LTEARLKNLRVKVTSSNYLKTLSSLKDGTVLRKFLVKKGELEAINFLSTSFRTAEGGHRVYADKYFVKQASEVTLADGAKF
jgi:hypothetical protein